MKGYITLEYGRAVVNGQQLKNYHMGDALYGQYSGGAFYEELAEWDIQDAEAAIEALSRYECERRQIGPDSYFTEEYALLFIPTDEHGDRNGASWKVFAKQK